MNYKNINFKKLRLTDFEINQIKNIAKTVFGNDVKIWIFGSRTNPHLKGGDIDVYIEIEKVDDIISKKLDFLVKLKDKIGEQKIDVIIKPVNCYDFIAKEAKNKGIQL